MMAQGEGPERGQDRRVGTVVGGRYRLLSVIGSGGMGVVYRAEHLLLKKELALKLLHAHLHEHPRGPELAQRFVREAQSLARLDQQHPHIVQIVDCGVGDDGTLYMAMELCEGESLCDHLARGPLSPARALHVIVQVLRALVHAHSKGIIHRDLKPDNVMLIRREGRDDFVKILDFGIAKLLSETEIVPAVAANVPVKIEAEELPAPPGGGQALTRAGVIFGTPEYLAPEQARGLEVDQRTDLYAVGVILWELLVGRRPFVGETTMQVIGLHLMAAPDPPSLHAPGPIPVELDEVVLRAMAKEPQGRFASAEEFLRALDVVLEKLDISGKQGRIMTPLFTTLRRGVRTLTGFGVPTPQALTETGKQTGGTSTGSRWTSRLRGPWVVLSRRLRAQLSLLAAHLGVRGTAVGVLLLLLLGTLGIVRLAGYLARNRSAQQQAQKLPAEAAQVLSRAEVLLGRGQLHEAQELLNKEYAAYPEAPRVQQLMGHFHMAMGDEAAALMNYREALRGDRRYRADSTLLRNLGRLLDHATLGGPALQLLQHQVGEAALPILYDCMRTCRDASRRAAAAQAATALGAPPGPLPVPSPAAEPQIALEVLIDRLEHGQSCNERRSAALALLARGDRRALSPLVRARRLASGRRAQNGCMVHELDDAIRALKGQGQTPGAASRPPG